MGKCLVGILICVAFLFSLSGIKGETRWKSSLEISTLGENTTLNQDGQDVSCIKDGVFSTNDHFSFDDFNARICDLPTGISIVSRGVGSSKGMRFISAIKMLASFNTPLCTQSTKNLYVHYCFVKSSCRYFVYTLERMLN